MATGRAQELAAARSWRVGRRSLWSSLSNTSRPTPTRGMMALLINVLIAF
jgi:hypothetical protein